MYTVAAAKLK